MTVTITFEDCEEGVKVIPQFPEDFSADRELTHAEMLACAVLEHLSGIEGMAEHSIH